jgi:hypothetical protein
MSERRVGKAKRALVMPDSDDDVGHGAAALARPTFIEREDVDGRNKSGHDELEVIARPEGPKQSRGGLH